MLDPTSYPLETANFLEEKKMLSKDYLDYGKKLMQVCEDYSKKKVYHAFDLCDGGYFYLRNAKYMVPRINLINVTSVCMKSKQCLDFSHLWNFLNIKEVQSVLGTKAIYPYVPKIKNDLNKSSVYRNFSSNKSVLHLIKKGYPVYYYTGEYDAMTPLAGFIQMLRNLGFDALRDQKSKDLGNMIMRNYKNVSIFQVKGCGQLVHLQKTEASYQIVKKLINSTVEVKTE